MSQRLMSGRRGGRGRGGGEGGATSFSSAEFSLVRGGAQGNESWPADKKEDALGQK